MPGEVAGEEVGVVLGEKGCLNDFFLAICLIIAYTQTTKLLSKKIITFVLCAQYYINVYKVHG